MQANTHGLWKHVTHPISFTLVVNNFVMKYMRQEDINDLIMCIKEKYELSEDLGRRPLLRHMPQIGL